MSAYLLGLVAVLATSALAVGGMLLVRKKVGVESLITYHEVAGYLLSIVGTLYAVLLGFVVVDAMEHTQELRVLVDQEASGLANIYLCANGLPQEERKTVQVLCHKYADAVIDDEWKNLEHGSYGVESFKLVWQLWKNISEYRPQTEAEISLHQQMVSEICSMTQNRRTRIVSAAHNINPLMWTVLLVGGTLTVAFTYFFGVRNVKVQIIMTSLVALTLSLNVFLVFVCANPFSGQFGIQPDSFKLDQMIFNNFERGIPALPDGT